MELLLIIAGGLVLLASSLWFLFAVFSESLSWGFILLVLNGFGWITQLGVAAGKVDPTHALALQVLTIALTLWVLFKFWEVVKRPFLTYLFGWFLLGTGLFLGGTRILSSPEARRIAGLLSREPGEEQSPAPRPGFDGGAEAGGGQAGFTDQEMERFDQIAREYREHSEDGMELDPRYERAVKDYEEMRGGAMGEGEGRGRSGGGQIHGGARAPASTSDPLIGGGRPSAAGDDEFTVSAERLRAASEAAKRGTSGAAGRTEWHGRLLRETEATKDAWHRVDLAMHDPAHGKELGQACQDLFHLASGLPRDLFARSPDERVQLHLSQTYTTLTQVAKDCMAGRLAKVEVGLQEAKTHISRATTAMAPYGLSP